MNEKVLHVKNRLLKPIALFLSTILLLSMTIVHLILAAVYGNLTFSNGINQLQKYILGKTLSTEVKNNMYFYGYVNFYSEPYAGQQFIDISPRYYNVAGVQKKYLSGLCPGSFFI